MLSNGSREYNKPVLDLPWTPLQVMLAITGLAGIGFIVGLLIYYWPVLPAKIPTHFGASGLPDSWDSKQTLLFPAGIGAVLYLMMFVLSRYPHLYNYPWAITELNAATQYRMASTFMVVLANVIIWMFTYIVWQTIQTALGQSEGMGSWFLPAVLFLTFGPVAVWLAASSRARNNPTR